MNQGELWNNNTRISVCNIIVIYNSVYRNHIKPLEYAIEVNNEDWDFKVFILFRITIFDFNSHKFCVHSFDLQIQTLHYTKTWKWKLSWLSFYFRFSESPRKTRRLVTILCGVTVPSVPGRPRNVTIFTAVWAVPSLTRTDVWPSASKGTRDVWNGANCHRYHEDFYVI